MECSDVLDNTVRAIRASTEVKNVPMKAIKVDRSYPVFDKFSPKQSEQLDEILRTVKRTNCCLDEINFNKVDIEIFKPFFLKLINTIISEGTFPSSCCSPPPHDCL